MDAVLRATCKKKVVKEVVTLINIYRLNATALVTEDDADVGTN